MTCDEISNDVLIDLAKREVGESEKAGLDSHLAECLKCGERYLEVKKIEESTRMALKAIPTPEMDRQIIDTTGKVLALQARHKRNLALVWVGIGILAAAAVIGLLLLI